MSLQEQVAQMAYKLSDDDAVFLIDFINRFMTTSDKAAPQPHTEKKYDPMQKLEKMRLELQSKMPPVPSDFDPKKEWEQAMEEKYGRSD